MATTYKAIATVTVGSGGAANIEFTSIPGTYTDLLVKLSLRQTISSTRGALNVTFNSNTSNYSWKELRNNDGTAQSTSGSAQSYLDAGRGVGDNATASTFSSTEIYIPNYASSNNKSVSIDSVTENNSSSDYYQNLNAGLWSNSAAITSIKIEPSSTYNWKQYSTATLYGIKNS